MELEKMKNELAALRAEADAKAKADAAEARRLAELQAAIDAEENRKNKKEYKNALAAINDLANEAEAQKQSIHKAVEALMVEIDTWADIVKKRKALARENRIEASDLFMAEVGVGGSVIQLRQAIEAWKNKIKFIDAMKGMYEPDNSKAKTTKRDSEREKMLKERYPNR
jgi:hypothetical protein